MMIGSRIGIAGKSARVIGVWPLGYIIESDRGIRWACWWDVDENYPPVRLATLYGRRVAR